MYKDKIIGIYKITNIINKKYYIGSAVNIKGRLKTHKRLLEQNKHYNKHLQSSYNKYGTSNFIYNIIEITKKENMIEREQFWIDLLEANNNKKGYNKRIIAESNLGIIVTDETKRRLSISHLGHKRSKETHDKILETQYKKVFQFDMDGNFLRIFNSLQEAAFYLGIKYATNISACARRTIPSASGYRWCFEKDVDYFKSLVFIKRGWHKKVGIELTNLKTGEIYRFDSIVAASQSLDIPSRTLSRTNKNKKYTWKKIKNIVSS